MTNKQFIALMVGGTVLLIGLIYAGCWVISATLRMWGLA